MNFRDKNVWASAAANFSFWGFLGSAVFGQLFAGVPPNIIYPETYYWYFLGEIWITISCFMFGYGVLRLLGRRKPMMIVGGFCWASLSLLPHLVTLGSPWGHIVQIGSYMGLGVGMVGWIWAAMETRADSTSVNLLSGWGATVVGLIMGYLAGLNTTFAGYSSSSWAMIFASFVPFLMMVSGLIFDETGPAVKKAP